MRQLQTTRRSSASGPSTSTIRRSRERRCAGRSWNARPIQLARPLSSCARLGCGCRRMADTGWYRVEPGELEVGRVTTVVAAGRALCITRTADGYGALDNRCPHQGGPLGDGQIENGYVICPWHGYEYNACSGRPPEGFSDAATAYTVDLRADGLYVELPVPVERITLMDQVVDVLTSWGIDTVFG